MVVKTTIERVRVLELKEKAVSIKQQRFFGMVRAAQKGEMKNPSSEVKKVAGEISDKDAKDFAKTKHKGLPVKKVEKESFEIDKSAHKKAQKKSKLRNLAKGNMNPNEKAAAEKKAGGPKLMGEATCGKGEYYCKDDEKCKPIPKGHHVMPNGDLMKDSDHKDVKEGNLRQWFKGSKSKDGKGGWVNVVTGGTCASDEPGEGTPKCVSSSKRASMSKKERASASRRKKAADPGQQSKSGAAKPTYVKTDVKETKILDKMVGMVKKKKVEKKPEKAMDAGARAKRLLQRKVHAKYVSGSQDNVPDDIRDHMSWNTFKGNYID